MQPLTDDQIKEVDTLLEQWGAWVYSGRIERHKISLIGKMMLMANPQKTAERVMCDDETGLAISKIVGEIRRESEAGYQLLVHYYVYGMTKYQIAVRFHRQTRDTHTAPSLSTYRRSVEAALERYRGWVFWAWE